MFHDIQVRATRYSIVSIQKLRSQFYFLDTGSLSVIQYPVDWAVGVLATVLFY